MRHNSRNDPEDGLTLTKRRCRKVFNLSTPTINLVFVERFL